MVTRYCALGINIGVVADLPSRRFTKLEFIFSDATHLASPTGLHLHHITVTVQDQDHFTLERFMVTTDRNRFIRFPVHD